MEGFLSCHTCCETAPRFSGSIWRTATLSHLLQHAMGCWVAILAWTVTANRTKKCTYLSLQSNICGCRKIYLQNAVFVDLNDKEKRSQNKQDFCNKNFDKSNRFTGNFPYPVVFCQLGSSGLSKLLVKRCLLWRLHCRWTSTEVRLTCICGAHGIWAERDHLL
jgi:hypothetical protein